MWAWGKALKTKGWETFSEELVLLYIIIMVWSSVRGKAQYNNSSRILTVSPFLRLPQSFDLLCSKTLFYCFYKLQITNVWHIVCVGLLWISLFIILCIYGGVLPCYCSIRCLMQDDLMGEVPSWGPFMSSLNKKSLTTSVLHVFIFFSETVLIFVVSCFNIFKGQLAGWTLLYSIVYINDRI